MSEIGQNVEREVGNCQIKVLTSEQLIERIYQGEHTPQDKRFLPIKNGGVFNYFHLGDLISYNEKKLFFVSAEVDEKIVGLSQLGEDPYKENNLFLQFVSVDPKYQGKGYASKILEGVFDFANKSHKSLELSFYTDEGKQKLEKVVDRLIGKTPIKIFDNHGQVIK
jgi:GNAT superfamily N-acetyltransferase